MSPDDALRLAQKIGAAYGNAEASIALYARKFVPLEAAPLDVVVERMIEKSPELPTIARFIAAYRAEIEDARPPAEPSRQGFYQHPADSIDWDWRKKTAESISRTTPR